MFSSSNMTSRYEVQRSEKLGRYLVAGKNLRAGETILSDQPFVVGPACDSPLVCFNCYQPVLNKFVVCKMCAVAPVCPDQGCPDHLTKWHNTAECDTFRELRLTKGLHPITMVQNVGSLTALRVLLKGKVDSRAWAEFLQLETHLEERRDSIIWDYYENTVKFIRSLGLLDGVQDDSLVQKICAAIDVNSFEARGPRRAAAGAPAAPLRAVYARAALLAHDCVANTHVSVDDRYLLVVRASADIEKGDTIYYNYTDPLKGTALRQQHLLVGKYFSCSCARCADASELGTHMSSARCPHCAAPAAPAPGRWACGGCQRQLDAEAMEYKVQCCSDKFDVINKNDEKELEEYIRNVSLVLAPNHYLLLDAKQRLAGVLRDAAASQQRPPRRLLRRKLQLCEEILPVLEAIAPGISRTKAITLYEVHATTVQLAKKQFDAREISAAEFMEELMNAEKYLKRSLEMLFIEPGNSPEGELCAKALEEYRALKATMSSTRDAVHSEGKTYVSAAERNETLQPTIPNS